MSLVLLMLASVPAGVAASSDPSGRVGRISHSQGDVSFSPAGDGGWYRIVRNRPLTGGDRLWTDRNALADIQVGSAAIRLGPQTSLEILDLHDGIGQFLVTQGSIGITVRRLYPGQVYEVATPNLAVVIERAGRYRIDVDPRYGTATIAIREGAATAYGERGRFDLHAGEAVRFRGTDLRDYQLSRLPPLDAFDRYAMNRDRLLARSPSLRHVGDDLLGYDDLDRYGDWREVRNLGVVWFPSDVSPGWAPYRDGHWVWQEPWGWTWVDRAPWGFAPSHYGRWTWVVDRWGWIPGPRNLRPVYAPALVAFVGGSNWSLSLSTGGSAPIGWFPLGPRDVYVPPYRASRSYFTQVNVSNTVVNNTTVTNIYNTVYATGASTVTADSYANRSVAGAVTAVPAEVFGRGASVRPAALPVDLDRLARSEVRRTAAIAPDARSMAGTAERAGNVPERDIFERQAIAVRVPPPVEPAIEPRDRQLPREAGPARDPVAPEPRVLDVPGRNIRVVPRQAADIDARAARPAPGSASPGPRAEAQPAPQAVEREVEPADQRTLRGSGRDDGAPPDMTERRPAPSGQVAPAPRSVVEPPQPVVPEPVPPSTSPAVQPPMDRRPTPGQQPGSGRVDPTPEQGGRAGAVDGAAQRQEGARDDDKDNGKDNDRDKDKARRDQIKRRDDDAGEDVPDRAASMSSGTAAAPRAFGPAARGAAGTTP
jgi:hypothetical protein